MQEEYLYELHLMKVIYLTWHMIWLWLYQDLI